MSYYDEHDKLISARVNRRKYDMVINYIKENKYRYPSLSMGNIFNDAIDQFIKEKHITEPKPIRGQHRMKF